MKFIVELSTKCSFDIEVAPISAGGQSTSSYNCFDAEEALLQDGHYLAACAIGDDWEGPSSLVVYDEEDNVVFKGMKFCGFRFVREKEDILGSQEGDVEPELIRALPEWERQWEEEKEAVRPGIYIVARHEMKWRTFRFSIEDQTFNPEKLCFVANKCLEGIEYDSLTDTDHIYYGDMHLELKDCDECYETFGSYYSVMERCGDGYWYMIREIDN